MKFNSMLICLLIFALKSLAAERVAPKFGSPIFSGSGCQSSNSNFAISPGGEVLSILFDNFRAEVGSGKEKDTKTCRITIPVEIPDNYSIRIFKVEYRGYNFLPKGTNSELVTQYGFNLKQDEEKQFESVRKKKFNGPTWDEFYDKNTVNAKSPCGGLAYLDISANLTANTKDPYVQAFSVVDTTDVSQPRRKKLRPFQYYLVYDKCKK